MSIRGVVDARAGCGTRICEDIDPEMLAIAPQIGLLVEMARNIDMPLERLLAAVENSYRRPLSSR